MTAALPIVAAFGLFVLLGLLAALFALWRRNRALLREYGPIIDAEAEVRRAKEEADRLRATTNADMERLRSETMGELAEAKRERATLSRDYAAAHAVYDRLKGEIVLLEENIEDISVGLYKPHYTYESSETYKEALESIRKRQKDLVKSGHAAVCGLAWEIRGDARAGQRMTKQYLKLVLRAFNAECDAAVAKVSWNNVGKMEERIKKASEAINEMGEVMRMRLTPEYLDLKLAELHLEYEYDEKKHQEQEEQRRIREQMREEERARREAEKAQQEAEEEEARDLAALEKARAEVAEARGEALEQLQLRIQHLDAALHKTQERKERANSMAQLTRSGYVYVISNLGSFGENIFKIGMTRRLDPMDRIWELSDASVPFDFDVHAMIYCEDAPSLEDAFQAAFREASVNLVNPRKEFFGVTIDQIGDVARQRNVKVEMTRLGEAKEYRQTLALRAKAQDVAAPRPVVEELPASL